MHLIFATHNQNKVAEINALLKGKFDVKSLSDIGLTAEIEETGQTLTENAFIKAEYIFNHFNSSCFADDSGLEVDALNGEPGVYSARYAGPQKNDDDNINKLLSELSDKTNRKARFKTVIALILNGENHFFEGVIEGEIIGQKRGFNGFGYDPIFVPDGYQKTFAEMSKDEKNLISHRAKAVKLLVNFLAEKNI